MVFALNTIVGFACAVGVDMGFNSKHHHDEQEATEVPVHIHEGGRKHLHHEHQPENSGHAKSHHHDAINDHQSKNSPDNCCNDKVLKFEQTEKFIAHPYAVVNPVFFTTIVSSYYNLDLILLPQRSVSIKYFVRSHHPPIPNIRIAIQSFQI